MVSKLAGLIVALCAGSCAVASSPSFPQPGKPIRILVGVAAGGGTDITARLVAEKLQALAGVPVVVENRPGASMMLAAAETARSAPDGHTLLYTPDSALTQAPHVHDSVPYNPMKSFTPISLGAVGSVVLVAHESLGVNTVKEFVSYAKAHPRTLTYASAGIGTAFHIYGEMLNRQAGLDMEHIPYKGAGDVGKDLLAGRIQAMFAAGSGALQFTKTGKVKMLGVAAPRRNDLLPGVPTLAEQGYRDFDIDTWLGWLGPAHMPPEIVDKLHRMFAQILAESDIRKRFREAAYEAQASTPAEMASLLQASYDRWGSLIRQVRPAK
ncbi:MULTISPECIES: tripartite tricarboxylate transporter substrate binding protein [Delftia]|uniref:Tripartite tricarboxylate transporter substrate binding protein n=1 Tax=Delftia acidovorans TaxID=80866 RepID=A0A7T2S2K3_DELAC|nr:MULTISPECIES: tripartite tricarboxylate transporter substrate binding protein [Delftia]QPS07770.1 tripartite tricarboxylate transporter substrate binding protein [Delftia acidovorans]